MYCMFYNLEFFFPYKENYEGKFRESDEQFEANMHAYATPLITAIIERRSNRLIKSLMTRDHIEEVDERHSSCLHLAAAVAPYNSEIIKELLDCKVDVNLQNKCGDTPLHLCAHNPLCDFNLVKILIDHGANVNIRNNSNETPLFAFIRNCYEEEKCEEHFKIIQCLLRNRAELNIQNENKDFPLFMAAELPTFISIKLAEEFLKYNIDLFVRDSIGNTVLHRLSSSKSQEKIVHFLGKRCPLLLSAKNFDGETPLHTAAFYRVRPEVMEALVINGADVNGCDSEGNCALHLIRSKSFPIVKCLVRFGANINAVNKYGHTPLMQSILNLRFMEETFHALIHFGADVNIQDFRGRSALHYAFKINYMSSKIVQILLENGVNPLNTSFGYRPPIYFCSNTYQTQKIYIQYVLLNILEDSDEYRDSYMELMRFDCYDEGTNEILSNFRDRCINDLFLMKRDKGFVEEGSLFDHVYSRCGYQSFVNTYPDRLVKAILARLHSKKYRSCKFLLMGCLKEKVLIEYIAKTKICSKNTSDQEADLISSAQNSVETVALDYGSILHISKFLDKDSLINLGIAASL